jgi:hypothetical protein
VSKARPETARGGRRLSDEHRAKLSERSKQQWARMTPEERAAATARIGRKPKAGDPVRAGTGSRPVSTPPPASTDPPPDEGRRSPLAMTPLELVRSLRRR